MDQPEQHSTAAASARVERRAKSVVRLWPRLQAASLLLAFTGMVGGSDQVMSPRGSALYATPVAASPVATSSSAPSWESFHETVQPVLAQYCLPCHGAERAEKGLRLDLFKDEE